MSPTIWTRCGGRRNARPLALEAVRVVESQHVIATRKLVDSDAEQLVLEELIDGVKPPVPAGLEGLHYLLATPFRHPPLRAGSRFGTRHERGIFYAARAVETALAEVAYYRFVFRAGTEADLGLIHTEHTAFRVGVETRRGVDLTRAPFNAYSSWLTSRTDYRRTQELGRDLRADGVEAAVYTSARDPGRGDCVAVFEPAFSGKRPHPSLATWSCVTGPEVVEFKRKNLVRPAPALSFPRRIFLVRGKLPAPAL